MGGRTESIQKLSAKRQINPRQQKAHKTNREWPVIDVRKNNNTTMEQWAAADLIEDKELKTCASPQAKACKIKNVKDQNQRSREQQHNT